MNKNEKEFFELELAFLKCRRETIDKQIEEIRSKLKAEEEKKTFFELLDMVLEHGYPKEIKTENAVYAIKEVRKDLNHVMDTTDYAVKDDEFYYEDIISEIADDYTFSELLTYKGFIAIY